jgi:coenzyme F420-0:L-glutamate ligase / coenzyme F420-1:gamma-L-glutamate ligase
MAAGRRVRGWRGAERAPTTEMRLIALGGLPEVTRGADLAALVVEGATRSGVRFERGDVLVLAQKIVSKAEGRTVALRSVKPSALAREWAPRLQQDPRLIEVVLRESRRVIRMTERALIVETRHGFVCANAGVDRSNVPGERVTLLPVNPDASARRIAAGLLRRTAVAVPVVISDTFGRPWRLGLVNVAIGAWGLRVLEDLRGTRDALGHRLRATILAVGDELAAAAGLLMGKKDAVPAVIVRGFRYRAAKESARRLIRPAAEDMFR